MTRQGGWPASGFGQRLKEIRESSGRSQFQLAVEAGCRTETISRLERGEQEPAWPLVLALARALGVSCEAFQVNAPVEEQPSPRGRPKKADTPATDQAESEVKPSASVKRTAGSEEEEKAAKKSKGKK